MVSKNVRVIGIDLGTTCSKVGFWIGEKLIIGEISPCITLTDHTKPVIGFEEAFDGVERNPVFDINRLVDIDQKDLISWPVEVIVDPRFSDEELLSKILKDLKQYAEKGLGLDHGNGRDVIINAVISVPSCFNNAQRLATKRAATVAGFGDTHINQLLSFYATAKLEDLQNEDFLCISGRRSKSRLSFPCEDPEGTLCYPNITQITVDVDDSFYVLPLNFQSRIKVLPSRVPVTQHVFDEAFLELLDKCEEAIGQCLQDSGISRIHEIIVVGGSTKISRIRDMLRLLCSDEKGLCEIMNPNTAVVQGAAIQAAILSGEALSDPLLNGISITDVVPLSLIARCLSSHGLTTFRNLIPRNTMIPTKIDHRFTTATNDQTSLYLGVHQGEEAIMKNNDHVGYFIFDGIQAAEMGVPNITVTFAVDDDGILNVSAVEDESHKQLARRGKNRSAKIDELIKLGRDVENPEQEVEEASERSKLKARLKVWLVTQHVSPEVPDDFAEGLSPSQVQRLREAVKYAEIWLENNELPEIRASVLKLDELQRKYFLILQYELKE
ncbi:hypothetical protein MKX01_027368 [Papaver californicum]|nr:hypothetical protein MKX01_027368 [Papaver californicum]